MRFSFTSTCVLSFFLLVATTAAIPAPREGHSISLLNRRDAYDDVVELHARANKAPVPHHPRAWGKTEDKKLPAKSKEQRKEEHERQQANAKKTRHEVHLRRKTNLEKHRQLRHGKEAPVKSSVSKEQEILAKKKKVQMKAKSTQLEAKEKLDQRKKAGRMKFNITRKKYHATDNLPDRKTTFTTPNGQKFTGADARRAIWNTHHFTGKPTNFKPAMFRNVAGSAAKPQRVIETMEGTGTEFPMNNHKHGYQGRPQPVKVKGQTPLLENPGPARVILQQEKKSQRYNFQGVVSHDERKQGKGASAGEHAHHHIIQKHDTGDDINGDAMRKLFG